MIQPVTLTGSLVTLVPLTSDHAPDLKAAAQDGELWKLWYTFVPAPENMEVEIARRLALQQQGTMLPFAVLSYQPPEWVTRDSTQPADFVIL